MFQYLMMVIHIFTTKHTKKRRERIKQALSFPRRREFIFSTRRNKESEQKKSSFPRHPRVYSLPLPFTSRWESIYSPPYKKNRHSREGGNPYSHHEAHEETKRTNKKVASFPRHPRVYSLPLAFTLKQESTSWIPAYAGMTTRYNHA